MFVPRAPLASTSPDVLRAAATRAIFFAAFSFIFTASIEAG
jgi:hypothetical protein